MRKIKIFTSDKIIWKIWGNWKYKKFKNDELENEMKNCYQSEKFSWKEIKLWINEFVGKKIST